MAGCAPQSDFSAVSTSPVTMVCDGGKSFTVAYSNGFETAVIEAEGRRLELQKVRTTLGMNPARRPHHLGIRWGPIGDDFAEVERGGGGPA